jgi:hypothetical protein
MDYIKTDNTYFATPKSDPKDKIEVEVGDDKEPDIILPQVKIQRWDNEANVSFRLKDFDNYSVIQEDNKVKFGSEDKEAHLYELTEGEGGFEFEVILNKKPKTNKVEFTLVDKDVEYFYQSELTQEEKDRGASRPDNVVGSYAVYAKSNKINYFGGKEYKVGKVGHIFRPKIIDSVGTEVWGELHIENGILSVTIPQDFLDKAIYPIRHAAGLTFGYTTHGATSYGAAETNKYYFVNVTGAAGSADSISAYYAPGGKNQKGVLCLASTGAVITNGITDAFLNTAGAPKYVTSTYSTPPTISAVGYYIAVIFDGNNQNAPYYDSTTSDGNVEADSYASPGSIAASLAIYRFSNYCTYTAGGAAGPAKLKTWNGLATAKIKTINGLEIAKVKTINGLV